MKINRGNLKDFLYNAKYEINRLGKKQGVCYRSAWNYSHADKIPGAFRLPSGAIIVPDDKPQKQEYIVAYARVSS